VTETHHPHHRHPHHTADPAALEDPVHHDVAAHELEVEAESDEDTEGESDDESGDDTGETDEGQSGADFEADEDIAPNTDWDAAPAEIEPTGDDRVDAAVDRLAGVRGIPVSAHVEVYEDVHRSLQDALADLDGS
jgi:hypothetical protein